MTTYRKIHGRAIQAVTTDPSESVTEGQVWYNTNSDTFKSVLQIEAWSSGSPMITARRLLASSSENTQSSAWGAGGYVDGTGDQNSTEEYNGSGFSVGGNLTTARR